MIIKHRYDFVFLFDVTNGNPNGDPDAGNSPRIDSETGHGLVSDVCLKRKVRDFVCLKKTDMQTGKPEAGFDIYVKHQGILEQFHRQAYEACGLKLDETANDKKMDNVVKARAWMCQTYYDIRTFGAVMSMKTGNCGQVRGPVQITFSKSFAPIASLGQSITRKAVTTQSDADKQIEKHGQITGTFGRKEIIPYALYQAHGFISSNLAADTGFTEKDLELLWEAFGNMFEHDRSASRGLMSARKLIVFKHDCHLGNAPAHKLFSLVKIKRNTEPARAFEHYDVIIDRANLPEGVSMEEKI